jgi:hypothetical protein
MDGRVGASSFAMSRHGRRRSAQDRSAAWILRQLMLQERHLVREGESACIASIARDADERPAMDGRAGV